MASAYLDHASGSPLLPDVAAVMAPFLSAHFGSPASFHRHGLEARDTLRTAREQVRHFLNAAHPEEILFTASGTEAANMAILGTAEACAIQCGHFIATATEHPAILSTLTALEKRGFRHTLVPVDAQGRVSPAAVLAAVQPDTRLAAVHLANFELGTLQPIQQIAVLLKARRVPLYADAALAAGWQALDVQTLGVTLLSFSAHRFHGPPGVGVLYHRQGHPLAPLIHGGTQEHGLRAGTENIPSIAGAGAACAAADREGAARRTRALILQQTLHEKLQAAIAKLHLLGPEPGPERLPHHLHYAIEGIEGEALVLAADLQGVSLATGPACVSRALKVFHVLKAIGLEPRLAGGNIMITLGATTTDEEIAHASVVIPRLVDKLRTMSPGW